MTKKTKLSRRLVIALSLLLIFSIWIAANIFSSLPSLDSIAQNFHEPSIRIVDRNDRLLYELIPGEGRNIPLSPKAIPQCIKNATIAVEDKNFYQNPGIDIIGIMRALWINLQGGEIISGGSTITQQVARNLLLSEDERFEQSLKRKLREAVLAWQLTRKLSKDEILALYLNQMYYGGLAYGVEAASQTYFGKPVQNLILPECALLAGLPQAPGLYNPYTNLESVIERQQTVLSLMERQGFISSTERTEAERFSFKFNSSPYPIEAPHFIWIVKNQLDQLYDAGILSQQQSLVIRTTLDLDYQRISESVIERYINSFHSDTEHLDQNVNNAASVVLDPHSGEIFAMVGSVDYFDASIHGAVNMAISPRQTGSALKPFIYAQALDPSGSEPWTAAITLLDITTSFSTRNGQTYIPSNYDGLEHGFISLRETLGSSLNIPAVLTLERVGIEDTVDFLKQLGITSVVDPQNYDLSLALGGGQISLLELSSAYAAFASGGIYYGNHTIMDIQSPEGEILYTPARSAPQERIDPRVAWLISDILSDDSARITGFGANSTLKIDRPAAVKTGTTTNFHDNWTIGYTPELVVGVWVGNSNHEAMHGVTGLTGAAPIWHETIRTLLQGKPALAFERPAGLVEVEVCAISGLLPTPACQKTKKEWFLEETVPTITDSFYREVFLDTLTGFFADETTPASRRQSVIVLDLPEEAAMWAREQGWTLFTDIAQRSANGADTETLMLISPRPNTTYRIDPNFALSSQQIMVEAVAGLDFIEVSLWVDGNLLEVFNKPPYQVWWQLSVGERRFWVTGSTSDGRTISSPEVLITVIND